ncbi:MAG: SMP-30/gluconolactonase/LRE family protein [bacterium]|nr:SMP-30/gluconolactonase/LRE family protein [bacterium]
MRRTCFWTVLIGCLLWCPLAGMAQGEAETTKTLVAAWETAPVFKVPESVLYDGQRNALFVANIHGKPTSKDGVGFISRVSLSGEVEKLEWVTGLNAPKGMGVHENTLYVTDIDRLVAIDVETAQVVKEYVVPEAGFLNDVAVDAAGRVYFSDMSAGNSVIYRLAEGKVEPWVRGDEINRPNGLYAEKDRLIVGNSGDGRLKAVDFATRSVGVVAEIGAGIDGVEGDGEGGYLISDWSGATSRVSPSGEVTKLLDTTAQKINSADIEYVPESRLLLIPTFFDNRVMAYHLR